jgi:hypothetical protein
MMPPAVTGQPNKWCGHGQEVIPIPQPDGAVTSIPVLGEATVKRREYVRPPRREHSGAIRAGGRCRLIVVEGEAR